MSEIGRLYGAVPPVPFPEYPRDERVQPLIDLLHDQGIGCNYRPVQQRRSHTEPGGDPEGWTVRVVWDDPEPTGYDGDGWKHEGDHKAVARAVLGLVPDDVSA